MLGRPSNESSKRGGLKGHLGTEGPLMIGLIEFEGKCDRDWVRLRAEERVTQDGLVTANKV